ncbi:MAG: DMP19 family protein, partial [Chitinophagales bacterium]|nr:DMP19 family protein [Chitinophagales bacterium]
HYFFYSGGNQALETPDVLKKIGANKLSETLEEAILKFPNGAYSIDIDERQNKMNEFGDDIYTLWEDFDQKVYVK